jgi:hypothetical protein
MVSSWGLSVVSTVAEKGCGVTSWCCTVVTLTQMRSNGLRNWSRWGEKWEKLSVQPFTFAIATKRSVATSFDRSWVYFLAWFWGVEGYEHGSRQKSDGWILHTDYSRALTAQENFYAYCFHLASSKEIWCYKVVEFCGKRPIRQRFPKDHYEEKGRLMKEFHNLLYERWLHVGTSKQSCSHL